MRQKEKRPGKGANQSRTGNPKFSAPASFWEGWGGPASMAPPIHRKPQKPANTLWRPEVKR